MHFRSDEKFLKVTKIPKINNENFRWSLSLKHCFAGGGLTKIFFLVDSGIKRLLADSNK
jgi:hypothetical protein